MCAAPREMPHTRFIACRWPITVDAKLNQSINLAKEFAHLMGRVAQRHCPQPLLQARNRSLRLRQQAPPVVKHCFAELVDKASGQRRFDIACGLHKQGRERAVLLDQDAMFIEPSLELLHEIGTIRAPREPLLEPAHDIAALMFGHRHEP